MEQFDIASFESDLLLDSDLLFDTLNLEQIEQLESNQKLESLCNLLENELSNGEY